MDEVSSFITVRDNWTEGEKYLQNANGPGNVWENNGPKVDSAIRERAGLESGYSSHYLCEGKNSEFRLFLACDLRRQNNLKEVFFMILEKEEKGHLIIKNRRPPKANIGTPEKWR